MSMFDYQVPMPIEELDRAMESLEGARFSGIKDIIIFKSKVERIVDLLFRAPQYTTTVEVLIKNKSTITCRITLNSKSKQFYVRDVGYRNTAKYTRDYKVYGRGRRQKSFTLHISPEKELDAAREAIRYILSRIMCNPLLFFENVGKVLTSQQRETIERARVLLWEQFSFHEVKKMILTLMEEGIDSWKTPTHPEIPVFLDFTSYQLRFEANSRFIPLPVFQSKEQKKEEEKTLEDPKFCWNCKFWCCKRNQIANTNSESFRKSSHRCPINGHFTDGSFTCGNWKQVK